MQFQACEARKSGVYSCVNEHLRASITTKYTFYSTSRGDTIERRPIIRSSNKHSPIPATLFPKVSNARSCRGCGASACCGGCLWHGVLAHYCHKAYTMRSTDQRHNKKKKRPTAVSRYRGLKRWMMHFLYVVDNESIALCFNELYPKYRSHLLS